MKKLIYSIVLISLLSCKNANKNNGKFILDNGISQWNYGTINGIDSLDFVNEKHVTIYIEGKKTEIKAPFLRVARLSK